MTSLKKDIKEAHDIIGEQQKRLESQAERISELEKDCMIRESRINSVTRSLDKIEEEVDLLSVDAGAIQLSPIEEAVVYYDDPIKSTVINKKSAERAALIVKKFLDWSSKSKNKGHRLSVKEDNLINLYESEYGEKLQSTQFRRSFEVADNLSRGKLSFKKRSGNELHLLPGKELITTKKELKEKKKLD